MRKRSFCNEIHSAANEYNSFIFYICDSSCRIIRVLFHRLTCCGICLNLGGG